MNRRLPHARERVLDAYRERRDRNRHERNRRKLDLTGAIRAGLLLLLVAQCLRVAFASPRLRLQQVEVTGTSRLAAQEVIRLGRVPVGQNIFAVNLVKVSDALHAVPTIKDATVTRDLPGALHVEIQERRPAIRIATAYGNFHADKDGVVFEKALSPEAEMPTVQLQVKDLPRVGTAIRPEWVKAIWSCVELAKTNRVNLRTMRIDASSELWLNVATSPADPSAKSELLVRIGRYTELPAKFQDLRNSLTGWPALAGSAAYLDVMCAGSPAYMRMPENAKEPQQDQARAELH